MFELFVALRHLMSRERRAQISTITIISILGVIIGVAALVAVIAVMDGADREYFRQLIDVYAHIEVYDMGDSDMKQYGRVLEAVREDPEVVAASAALKRPAALKTASRLSDTYSMGFAMIFGVDPEIERKVTQIGTSAGPGGRGNRVTGNAIPKDREIVLGSVLAEEMGAKVGDSVFAIANDTSPQVSATGIKQTKLRVVGIAKSGLGDVDRQVAYATLATVRQMNNLADTVDIVHAKIKDPRQADVVRNRLAAKLGVLYGQRYLVRSWNDLNPGFFAALHLQRLTLFVILMLVIVVAALNIVSTLMLVTMEKTREIGVLRAMGTSRRSIRRIFLIEGGLIGFAGTSLGVLLGLVICWLLKYHFPIELPAIYGLAGLPVVVKWTTILEIVVCSVGISLLAAMIPAAKAARLDVVEALRYE